MSKLSILEKLQEKQPAKEREIVKVKIVRPKNIEIIENLKDPEFNPYEFRKDLLDRHFKSDNNLNINVFKNIKELPNVVKKGIKNTINTISESKVLTDIKPKKSKPKPLKPEDEIVFETVHLDDIKIKDVSIQERLPEEKEIYNIKPSTYFLHNREKFVNFIDTIFEPYRKQIMGEDKKKLSCDSLKSGYKGLLTHQQIIRDYMSIYSPYRGLLLYHGLGAGKLVVLLVLQKV